MSAAKLITNLVLISASSIAFASGGGGSYGSYSTPSEPVDTKYEYGKSVYQGRANNVPKIKYCVDNGKEKVKLKRSSLRPFKGGTVDSLTAKLYDCDNLNTLIGEKISTRDFSYVIYYLNKRYRLNLRNG